MTQTIAITGATGQLGRLATAALKTRAPDAHLVALVRDPAKAADLGIEARAFDYHAKDSLPAALKGVDVLVLVSSSDFNDRAGQHRNVIDAAKEAGVKRVVYTSILKGDASPMILAGDHIATEEALKASGIPATILRNGWYTENYTGSIAGVLQSGMVAGANASAQITPAARADFAEAVAVARAMPKSTSLTRPDVATSTLLGFTSRCTMRRGRPSKSTAECACSRPSQTARAT